MVDKVVLFSMMLTLLEFSSEVHCIFIQYILKQVVFLFIVVCSTINIVKFWHVQLIRIRYSDFNDTIFRKKPPKY